MMKVRPRFGWWVSLVLLACDRPTGEPPGVAPVVPAPAPAQAQAPIAGHGAGLNDASLGVHCERTGGEPLQLKPEGPGRFRLEYRTDAGQDVTRAVRCNPITSSAPGDLKFDCTDSADPGRQVLKISTETRQYEDELGILHPYLMHLHDLVPADGRAVHSEGDCRAYQYTKEGTRRQVHHSLELSCTGTIAGGCGVVTDLVFALESFPVIDDQTAGKLTFTATARASVQIREKDGQAVLTEYRLAPAELAATAAMDFSHDPRAGTRLMPQDGDFRARSKPAVSHFQGGTIHQFDFIHYNDRESSLYLQPAADSPSLKRCALVGPGDVRHQVDSLQCTKKLTPT